VRLPLTWQPVRVVSPRRQPQHVLQPLVALVEVVIHERVVEERAVRGARHLGPGRLQPLLYVLLGFRPPEPPPEGGHAQLHPRRGGGLLPPPDSGHSADRTPRLSASQGPGEHRGSPQGQACLKVPASLNLRQYSLTFEEDGCGPHLPRNRRSSSASEGGRMKTKSA
jgi:hypothetical protein